MKTNDLDDFAPVEHVLQSRQGKCKSLAAASLGDANNVTATPNDRPALGLDWGGLLKVFDDAHDLRVRAEVGEVLNRFVGLAQSACNGKIVKLVNTSLRFAGANIGYW